MSDEKKQKDTIPPFPIEGKLKQQIQEQLQKLIEEEKTSSFQELIARIDTLCKDKDKNTKNLDLHKIVNDTFILSYEHKYGAIYKGDRNKWCNL